MAWAGKYNEKVEIYKAVKNRNSFGEEINSMVKDYTTRAQVIYNGGQRSLINYEIQYPYTKKFILRIYVPINEDSWIKWKGDYYRVESIEESREWQEKTVMTEIVNDGDLSIVEDNTENNAEEEGDNINEQG